MPDIEQITDALQAAQRRGLLPTSLGTAELREMGEEVLARSVFTARGTNATFVDALKKVVDAIAGGEINEATARVSLLETLRALGYTPEGGFPDAPEGSVPPAVRGTLQDLTSARRLRLIVQTQTDLMRGAGQQMRGQTAERLAAFPAWELVRVLPVEVPRDWPTRWLVAGGAPRQDGRLIALKGDPVWGELGSYQNFEDALGVDYPPFAFNSGMGWREITAGEARALGIRGPHGETIGDFQASEPRTLAGKLPPPVVSTTGMDPSIRRGLEQSTGSQTIPGPRGTAATTPASRADEIRARMQQRLENAVTRRQQEYEGRGE